MGPRRGTRDRQPKRLIPSKNIEDFKGLSPLAGGRGFSPSSEWRKPQSPVSKWNERVGEPTGSGNEVHFILRTEDRGKAPAGFGAEPRLNSNYITTHHD